MQQDRAFKGIWIPKEIWLSKDLTLQEKVFLVEIDSLDNDIGCYASNQYFADFFGLSKNRSSEIIKSLEKKGLINITYQYKKNTKLVEKRIIRVFGKSINGYSENRQGYSENRQGYSENRQGYSENRQGYSENCEDNNININNINNNINNITSLSSSDDATQKQHIDFNEIKEYFNTNCCCFPSIREMTDKRKKTIKSFLKDHSEVELYQLFDMACRSSFLTGNNNNGWRADFDWIIAPRNRVKILEGVYENRQQQNIPKNLQGLYNFIQEEENNNGFETIF